MWLYAERQENHQQGGGKKRSGQKPPTWSRWGKQPSAPGRSCWFILASAADVCWGFEPRKEIICSEWQLKNASGLKSTGAPTSPDLDHHQEPPQQRYKRCCLQVKTQFDAAVFRARRRGFFFLIYVGAPQFPPELMTNVTSPLALERVRNPEFITHLKAASASNNHKSGGFINLPRP